MGSEWTEIDLDATDVQVRVTSDLSDWCLRLNCTERDLLAAVAQVGSRYADVVGYLNVIRRHS